MVDVLQLVGRQEHVFRFPFDRQEAEAALVNRDDPRDLSERGERPVTVRPRPADGALFLEGIQCADELFEVIRRREL